MILTEEMIKNLPIITEEELKEISQSQEEFIEEAIKQFYDEVDKIDELYDRGIIV